MDITERAASDQEPGLPPFSESILAIDVNDRSALGCSLFSTADGTLKIGTDISMAGEDVVEHFLSYAQPTTILVSRRVPESIFAFIEHHTEKSDNEIRLRQVSSSDFSQTLDYEELSSIDTSSADVERQYIQSSIQAPQKCDHQESQFMKLVRRSSSIDLENVTSLGCASAILIYLHRRRSVVSPSGDSSTEYMFGVRSVTLFNFADYVFISEESKLSLQVISHESYPNRPASNVDSKSSAEKENLSVYGLFHPLASTPQGRTRLRHMFLRPVSNLDILSYRQRAIGLLLHHGNEEARKRAVATLRKMGNVTHAIAHLQKGIGSSSAHKAFMSLALIGDMISRVINFDEAKSQKYCSVRLGVDPELDALKREYDGLSSFTKAVVKHVAEDLPAWARQHIRCAFFPQLGFLTAVKQESQLANDIFNGESGIDNSWREYFTHKGMTYYKNRHMEDLDRHHGDVHSKINDKEIEVMQKLATDVIVHKKALLEAADSCGEFDALLALAIGAAKYKWHPPKMTNTNVIRIKGGRHPLQELLVPSFVPNDCFIGEESMTHGRATQALVLTGPNQSGKSVYIKQVAIIVYLAHIGSYVPAEEAEIGTVDKILTRLPSQESVSRVGSAFALDLKQVIQAMKYSTSRSLVLMDEFGNGTAADGGAGMFTAMLDHFLSPATPTPKLVVATHFHEVFSNGYLNNHSELSLMHMDVRADMDATNAEDKVTYLFQLTDGYSLTGLGNQCAVLNGIPQEITDRAEIIGESIRQDENLTYSKLYSPDGNENLGDIENTIGVFLNLDLSLYNTFIKDFINNIN
ncbi:muts domain V domain-containing protein [Trichoderma sp. SZMC 28014]